MSAHAASGYAKRKARVKKDTLDVADVYEYAPAKGKGKAKRNETMELGRDELIGYEHDEPADNREARLLGSGDELDSDDDEDIDSDAAFEESDEERYAGFFGKMDQESESESEGEFIDVLDILDGNKLTSFVASLPVKRKAASEEPETPAPKRRLLTTLSTAPNALSLSDVTGFDSSVALLTSSALPAPLPLRAKEKLDREAAYELTKAEVHKWSDTVKRVHTAEFLSFPLQSGNDGGKVSAAGLAASFNPKSGLESGVDALLRKAGLKDDKDVNELPAMDVSIEEVREKRRLAKERREMMFREEKKGRRVGKIKSKAYRKHHRPQEDEQEQNTELQRAKERATLKHKNTGPKRNKLRREEVEEMLDREEKLRARIHGVDESSGEELPDIEPTGVMAMKFMQRAREEMPTTAPSPPPSSSNPWLQPSSSSLTQSKKNNILVKKSSSTADKAAYRLATKAAVDDDDNDDDNDDDMEIMLPTKASTKLDKSLVQRAFAGDDVVREFAATKAREQEAEAPKVVDNTLAGWGSWGGQYTKPTKQKHTIMIPGTLPATRADAGKPHLIISHRKDKKFEDRYRVKDVPYPYTSRAQYEAAVAGGIGREWNTRVGVQRATRPRVVKKMGRVIEPLEKIHS